MLIRFVVGLALNVYYDDDDEEYQNDDCQYVELVAFWNHRSYCCLCSAEVFREIWHIMAY